MDYAATVEDAVKKFYSCGSKEAHTWILQVQASPEAWTFVWQLLDPAKPREVQFYGATTLHAKISRQLQEVPENEYPVLQARVLNSIKMPNTPKLVLSKLCQALASFLANTYSIEAKEKDDSLIEQVMEMLPYNSTQTLDLLLRVLAAIPVEFEKRQNTRPMKYREGLISCWGKTTWLLQQVFQTYERTVSESSEESLYLLGLECALAWLKLGQLPLDITAQIYPHFLVAASNYAPSRDDDEDLDSGGWEIVQECLIMALTHGELHKRPQLFWEWSKSLVSLARQHGGSVFCRVLTALGEARSRLFLLALTEDEDVTHRWTSETLIELLLECSEHKGRYPVDEIRSCIPFGFWYVLQDDLGTLDQPLDSRALNALKPIYARLAQALLRKATLPSSPSEAGHAQERELLRCYRQDAADTLVHCYNVLGKDLLILLGQRLSQLQTEPQKWTDVESTLHAFNALSESVETQEDHYVPALMDLIVSHIPYGHYPGEVLACACSTIGAYAEWIGLHPDPWLERVLQLVGHGLTLNSVTSTPASMALKDIARECGPSLAPLAPSILETIEGTLPNIPPGGGEGLRLMYAAGKLINSLVSIEQQMSHLDATLGLCVGRLRELLEHPIDTARLAVANQLKMITMFLSTLQGSIGKAVLDGLLPIFMQIVEHHEWSQDDVTLEAMHSCAQKSLPSLRNPENEARPLLTILATSYKTHPHPSALALLRQLVLLFGRDPDNVAGPIFAELSAHTLGGVAACRSIGGNLSDLSDLLEAYLQLLAQICKKNARMLLKVPDQIPEMLRCGIACLILPETGTAKAAGSFLTHAIMQSPHLQTFIQPIGQELVCVILQCVGGSVARTNLEPHAEVLLALNKTCLEWTGQWLRLALVDVTAPIATESQKQHFSRKVLREQTNKRQLCETLKEFSLQCHRPVVGL